MSEIESAESEKNMYEEIIHSLEGRILPKRYRLEKMLSANAFTALFQTVYEPEEKIVNLLFFRTLLKGENDYQFVRFRQEVKKLRSLNHINVSKVLDEGVIEEGLPYIVYEQIEGPTLEEVLLHQNRLDPVHVGMVFSQVSKAVQAAHDLGFMHETLKPSRIIISETASGDVLTKVRCFGLLTLANKLGMNLKRPQTRCSFIGTAAYMSPEMSYEGAECDGRSDIYSIGCMMYESLSGQVPFLATDEVCMRMQVEMEPTPIPVLRKDLKEFPKRLLAIVDKCLLKDPTKRYQFTRDLASDIERDADPSERDKKTVIPAALQKAQARVKESKEPPLKLIAGILLGLLLLGGVGYAASYLLTQTSKLADNSIWQMKLDAAKTALKEQKYTDASLALDEALKEAKKFSTPDIRMAKSLNEMADYQIICGHFAKAAAGLREALQIEEELSSKETKDPQVSTRTCELLAIASLGQGKLKEAEEHARRALEEAGKITEDATVPVFNANLQLFYVYLAQKKLPEAQGAIEKMKEVISKTNSILSMNIITGEKQAEALLKLASGKTDLAEKELQEILGDRQAKIGLASPATIETMLNLGNLYLLQKKESKAVKVIQGAYAAKEKLLGDANPCMAELQLKLANAYDVLKDKTSAEKSYRLALELAEKSWTKGSTETLPFIDALSKYLRAQKNISAAQVYEQEALEIRHPEKVPSLVKH